MKNYIKTKKDVYTYCCKMPIRFGGDNYGDYYAGTNDHSLHRYGVGLLKKENILQESKNIVDLLDGFYCGKGFILTDDDDFKIVAYRKEDGSFEHIKLKGEGK